mmetsp:Transcript_8146/g.19265  ORF Transcript_8146/g.19265 Transcript_8146/m.19265 type:complete len:695 (-) Transcript_8146:140-2224(-)
MRVIHDGPGHVERLLLASGALQHHLDVAEGVGARRELAHSEVARGKRATELARRLPHAGPEAPSHLLARLDGVRHACTSVVSDRVGVRPPLEHIECVAEPCAVHIELFHCPADVLRGRGLAHLAVACEAIAGPRVPATLPTEPRLVVVGQQGVHVLDDELVAPDALPTLAGRRVLEAELPREEEGHVLVEGRRDVRQVRVLCVPHRLDQLAMQPAPVRGLGQLRHLVHVRGRRVVRILQDLVERVGDEVALGLPPDALVVPRVHAVLVQEPAQDVLGLGRRLGVERRQVQAVAEHLHRDRPLAVLHHLQRRQVTLASVRAALSWRTRRRFAASRRPPRRAAEPRRAAPIASGSVARERPVRRARVDRTLGAVAAGHALGAAFIRRLLAARAHHTPRQPSVSTEPRLAVGACGVVGRSGDEDLMEGRLVLAAAEAPVLDPGPRELVLTRREHDNDARNEVAGRPPGLGVVHGRVVDVEAHVVEERLTVRRVRERHLALLRQLDVQVELGPRVVDRTVCTVSARGNVAAFHEPAMVPAVSLSPRDRARGVEVPLVGQLPADVRLPTAVAVPAQMQALVHAPVVRPEVHVAVLLPVGTGFGQRRQALGFQPLQGRLGEVVAGTVLGVTAVPEERRHPDVSEVVEVAVPALIQGRQALLPVLVLLARGHAVDDKGELCLTLRHAPHLDVCAWIHHAVP